MIAVDEEPTPENDDMTAAQAHALRSLVYVLACCALGAMTDSCSAAERSRSLRAEFQRQNPCPSTGKPRGPCPGYQVDHREALVCGGKDELKNLQWLAIEPHKEKTRVEVKLRRGPKAPT